MALLGYYPEMNQAKPIAQGEVSLSHYGKHYFIKTPLTLKTNRSVTLINVLTSAQLVPQAQHKVGWNEYKVTEKAMESLKNKYNFSYEFLL